MGLRTGSGLCPFPYPPGTPPRQTFFPNVVRGCLRASGYAFVQLPLDLTDAELAFWHPWSRQLVQTIDQVRSVAESESSEDNKRSKLDRLGAEVHQLLNQLDERPSPCGDFGTAIDALRLPPDAEPISLGEAIERLRTLAAMSLVRAPATTRDTRPRGRTRLVGDQQELPGLESINEGAAT